MRSPDSNLPLVLGALVALALHVALLPQAVALFEPKAASRVAEPPEQDRALPALPPEELELGREEATVPSIAWIPYEDFRELQGLEANTRQPAVQSEAEPTTDAPLVLNPVPAAPSAANSARETSQASAAQIPVILMPDPTPPTPLTPTQTTGSIPPLRATPRQAQPASSASDAAAASAAARPTEQDPRPTSAPRSDREADPTDLERSLQIQPGGVMVGLGLEIKTFRPDISVVGRLTAIPRSTRVQITFDNTGNVTNAVLLESTGYKDWDAAILASLYKWKASGERVRDAQPDLTLTLPYGFVE